MLIRARERAFPSLPIFSTTSLHNSSLRYKHTFFFISSAISFVNTCRLYIIFSLIILYIMFYSIFVQVAEEYLWEILSNILQSFPRNVNFQYDLFSIWSFPSFNVNIIYYDRYMNWLRKYFAHIWFFTQRLSIYM